MPKALEPVLTAVTEGLLLLLPVLFAWIVAEVRRRTQAIVVKRAVEQVEDENWDECEHSKKARAVELVAQNTGFLTRMAPKKVGKMVEKVLPQVQAQNSVRQPSVDRRSVDVVFKE